MGGVNQLERDLIRMRQCEGIGLAKKRGEISGAGKKYHSKHEGINYAVELYRERNMTVNRICKSQMCQDRLCTENLQKGSKEANHIKSKYFP